MATVLIVTGLSAAALCLGVRLYMSRAAEDRLAPGEVVDPAALRSPVPQPGFLACPPGRCDAAAMGSSPIFAMPWRRLQAAWWRMIAGAPRTRLVADMPASRRAVYIQRSALFRFPDIVTVEFVPLGTEQSSLIVFSRSRYGRYDFGVNRRRVENWLHRLTQIAGPSRSP